MHSPDIQIGTVAQRVESAVHGFVYDVLTTDERTLPECRTAITGAVGTAGDFWPLDEGSEVLILCPYSDENQAVIIGVLTSSEATTPEGWDATTHRADGRVHEFRNASSESVEGVLTRALLDDLVSLVVAIQSLVAVLGTQAVPVVVPGDGGASTKAAVTTAAELVGVGINARLSAVLSALNTSKANAGNGPHCSDALRASPGT